MIAVVLALTASAAWGTSDFLGGLKAKTVPLAAVLVVSQGVGLLAIAVLLAWLGRPLPADERLLLSFAAGAAAVTELGLLYLALARGPVIVVAPVAAVGATIPVAFGIAGGDPISAPIAAGFAFALVGSVAAAYEPAAGEGSKRIASGGLLALAAAVGIGVFLILFDAASEADPYWATGGMRVAGWVIALAYLVARRSEAPAVGALPGRVLLALAAIGLGDVTADAAFATASSQGDLSIVSVLASLYPVVTVVLAFAVLRERVHAVQVAGVALALAGIALLGGATG
jgi:drug/metabolite transporter (DMT)-like permease